MDQIRISAKNLGQVGLDDFCPRCYWIKLKSDKLPWQIFPGIFSSIDAYTKRVVHAIIDSEKPQPDWMNYLGNINAYQKAPHWSKFNMHVKKYGITLTGAVDDILVGELESIIIPDYKTAKYTPNQDKLMPMYQIQLNAYMEIAEACGIKPVTALFLVYFEPATDDEAAKRLSNESGFAMEFKATPVIVPIDKEQLNNAMETTREIFDLASSPDPKTDCKDCQSFGGIIDLLK